MITLNDFGPEDATSDWRARTSFGRILIGKKAIMRAAAKWQPFDPLRIAAPGSTALYPVLEYPDFKDKAFGSARKNQIWSMAVVLFWTVATLLYGIIGDDHRMLTFALAAGLIAVYLYLDYTTVTSNLEALSERAALVAWIYPRGLVAATGWALFMVCIGLAQLFLQQKFGGLEPLVRAIGMLYEPTRNGEWWRLATGPFFHASIAHWATNLAMVSFIGALATPISKSNSIAAFVIGILVSAAASASPLEVGGRDAFAGISGGIFAMMGWCAGAALRNPSGFPRRFGLTALSFGILNILLAGLLIPNASTVAHVAGWGTGIVLSFLVPLSDKPDWRACRRPDRSTAPVPRSLLPADI